MPANYPESLDAFVDLDGDDDIASQHQDDRALVIEAIEGFLGISGAAQSHNATLMSLLTSNHIGGRCYKKDADEIYVDPVAAIVPNAGGTVKKLRVVTSVTTLSASNLDTGLMAVRFYYIYLTADSASTEPVIVFSASSSAPSGYTNYLKIGWFYNESAGSLDITSGFVGNIMDGSGNPNGVSVSGTSDVSISDATYDNDFDASLIKIVTNGRPVLVCFSGYAQAAGRTFGYILDLDGSDVSRSEQIRNTPDDYDPLHISVLLMPDECAAGEHSIKAQFKLTSGSAFNVKKWNLSVVEL